MKTQDYLSTQDTQTYKTVEMIARTLQCTLQTDGLGTYTIETSSGERFTAYDFLSAVVEVLQDAPRREGVAADFIEKALLQLATTLGLLIFKIRPWHQVYHVRNAQMEVVHEIQTINDLTDYLVAYECATYETAHGHPSAVCYDAHVGWVYGSK